MNDKHIAAITSISEELYATTHIAQHRDMIKTAVVHMFLLIIGIKLIEHVS